MSRILCLYKEVNYNTIEGLVALKQEVATSETHVEEEELSLTSATPQAMKSGVKHSAHSREEKAVADERCESMEAVPETATGRTEQTSTADATEWNSAMNKQQQYILTQLSATTHNSSKEPGLDANRQRARLHC